MKYTMKHLSKEIGKVFRAMVLAESGDFETARSVLNEDKPDRNKENLQGVNIADLRHESKICKGG
jgi:hypothetical protein